MSLFLMQFDGGEDYVEAPCMKEAVAAWREYRRREWDDDEDPDGCALISRDDVVRVTVTVAVAALP